VILVPFLLITFGYSYAFSVLDIEENITSMELDPLFYVFLTSIKSLHTLLFKEGYLFTNMINSEHNPASPQFDEGGFP
jgi:hypothetical protein